MVSSIEPLEARIAPAINTVLSTGVLYIFFNADNDTASITATDATGKDVQISGTGYGATTFNSLSQIMVYYGSAAKCTATMTDTFGTFALPGGFTVGVFTDTPKNESLIDTTGGNNVDFGPFAFADSGASCSFIDTAAVPDTITASASQASYTLTDSFLKIGPTVNLTNVNTANLSIGSGVCDVSGWTHGGTITSSGGYLLATKSADFTLTNTSLVTSDGMNMALSGIQTASLTDSGSGHVFDLSGWGSLATVKQTGAGLPDTLAATKGGSFVLSDSSLTDTADGMNVTIQSGVTIANLTDSTGGHSFDVSGWTGLATLKNSAGGGTASTVIASKAAGFTLTNTSLTDTADGMIVKYSAGAIKTANLTDTAGGNSFVVDHWSYGGTLANSGSITDIISAAKAGNFTLKETSLSDSEGMNVTLSQSNGGFHIANLTDTVGGNTFDFGGAADGWTHIANLTDFGAPDTISATRAAGFAIADTALTDTSDGLNVRYQAGAIQTANLTDSGGGHTFTVDHWSYQGTFANPSGTADTISATKAGGFTLTDSALTDTADSMLVSLTVGFSTANLTDTAGGNTFFTSFWSGSATLTNNGPATDNVEAVKPGGFTLTNGTLTDTADAMSLTLVQTHGGIHSAYLIDTTGGHSFTVTGWTHEGTLDSQGAADSVIYTDTITNGDFPVITMSKSKTGKVTMTKYNIGVVLTDSSLYSTNGMLLGLTNITTASLTAGNGGNELLDGSQYSGHLTLTGSSATIGANNDTLVAGKGVNILIGGAEADRFVLTGFSVSDTLTPSTQGAAGLNGQRDLIDYSARQYADAHTGKEFGVTVNLGRLNTAQQVNVKSTDPTEKTEGLLTLTGLFDDLAGSIYNDVLTGDQLSNVIYGGGGSDTLAGGGVPPHKPAFHDFLVGNKHTKFAKPVKGEIDSKFTNGISPFPDILPIIVPQSIFAIIGNQTTADRFLATALFI